jgi:DNA polymerase III delta prime subunit
MFEAALSYLLSSIQTARAEPRMTRTSLWFDRVPFKPVFLFPSNIVLCRQRPIIPHSSDNPLERYFSQMFANHSYKARECMDQVRSFSNTRIEWGAKEGANILQMTVSGLEWFSPDGQFDCTVEPGNISFKNKDGDVFNIQFGKQTSIFTVYGENSDKLVKSACHSIASDISNNVRSYSYSWSSGEGGRLFDPHNPFGEMESLLDNFFSIPRIDQRRLYSEDEARHDLSAKPPLGQKTSGDRTIIELESMGVQVILPAGDSDQDRVDWSSLAGYEKVKDQVEESVIIGLKHSSLFERIIEKTRGSFSSAKTLPKVVLFEGPPGTGKTSTARIISNETNVPMIHIPLESVVSKWFGESEKQIARIYELARDLANSRGAQSVLLFIDEIDSLVSSRDIGSPHEASKRILSVMLRQIDGFSGNEKDQVQATLICATNRKKDLDRAFLSRVDASIHFGLPGEDARAKILKLYAKHLTEDDLRQLASITEGLSGRNLKDLCQAAERHWAANVIRMNAGRHPDADVDITPPPVEIYIDAAKEKFKQQIN